MRGIKRYHFLILSCTESIILYILCLKYKKLLLLRYYYVHVRTFYILMRLLIVFFSILLYSSCVSADVSLQRRRVQADAQKFTQRLGQRKFSSASFAAELDKFARFVQEQGVNDDTAAAFRQEEVFTVFAYLFNGQIAKARSELDIWIEKEPQQVNAIYLRALIAEKESDFVLAEKYLKKILKTHKQAKVYASLGEVFLEERKYKESRQAFEESLRREKNYIALRGLGNVLLYTKKYGEAERTFDKVIDFKSDDPFLYMDRALSRIHQNALRPAAADFTRAIRLLPEFPWNYLDRGQVYMELREYRKALDDYDIFITKSPQTFIGYVYRARAYDMLDNAFSAAQDYQKALNLRPDYYPAYAAYAIAQYLQGQYVAAAPWFKKAYEKEGYYEYLLLGAASWKWEGKKAKAKDFLESNLKNVVVTDPFYSLARLYLGEESPDRVRLRLRKLRKNADKIKVSVYLAIYYDQNNKKALAHALYQNAIARDTQGFFETKLARYHIMLQSMENSKSE